MAVSALLKLSSETDTAPADWEEVTGPETGVGIERWYENRHTGELAYTCDDQGYIVIDLDC